MFTHIAISNTENGNGIKWLIDSPFGNTETSNFGPY